MTAAIDLALALVEEDVGRSLALAVARHLVMFLKRREAESNARSPGWKRLSGIYPKSSLCSGMGLAVADRRILLFSQVLNMLDGISASSVAYLKVACSYVTGPQPRRSPNHGRISDHRPP